MLRGQFELPEPIPPNLRVEADRRSAHPGIVFFANLFFSYVPALPKSRREATFCFFCCTTRWSQGSFSRRRGGRVDAATLHLPVCIPDQARELNSGLPRVGASEVCLDWGVEYPAARRGPPPPLSFPSLFAGSGMHKLRSTVSVGEGAVFSQRVWETLLGGNQHRGCRDETTGPF